MCVHKRPDGSQIHLETGAGYPLSRVRLGWSL